MWFNTEMKVTYLAILLLFVMPFFGGTYATSFLVVMLMYMVLSLSYDIMGGMTGYLNFAHCTFFGVGAYFFGILYVRGYPLSLCFAIPVIVVLVYAAVVSYPLFRIRGVYFALATLGLVKLIEQLALNLRDFTGGSAGLTVSTGQPLNVSYYSVVILASIAFITNRIILKSKFGLALTAIREDENVAESFGINSYICKTKALLISAAFAGIMGAIYMFYIAYIVPESVFGLEMVFSPAIMAMLGGTGTLFGPVLGAVLISLSQEILWTKLAYLHMATYGIIFAAVGFYMPGGILREPWFRIFLDKIFGRFSNSKNEIVTVNDNRRGGKNGTT